MGPCFGVCVCVCVCVGVGECGARVCVCVGAGVWELLCGCMFVCQ